MEERPKLRALEAIPYQSGGEQLVCLRDPAGISRKTVVMPPRAFFIVALLDGEHTPAQIQAEYVNRFGDLIELEKITGMVQQLEEALLLEGPAFEARREAMIAEFARAPRRPASCAGTGYPAQPAALRKLLSDCFTPPGGPGPLDPTRRGRAVAAIVAPHIDLRRGGPAYAHAWKALAEGSPAETLVILGVAHGLAGGPFIVTDKEFETPLGPVACDRDFARDLMRRAGLVRGGDELLHRTEHSIEFQALWIRQVYGAGRPVRIVPVLCGNILEAVPAGADPLSVEPIARFTGVLRDILREQGERAGVVASVDLSHVGARFGDRWKLSPEKLAEVEAGDRALLAQAEAGDARALFASHRGEADRRRVCGFGALFTLLAALPAARGRLLHYAQSAERETPSLVSFAAMAFERTV